MFQVEEDEFVVEKILEKRRTKKGKLEYLVKWKGFDLPEDNTNPIQSKIYFKQFTL